MLFLVCSLSITSSAQERSKGDLNAMMVYNFLKYIQWPDGKNSGDFRIGVLGANDVFSSLSSWYDNKTKGNKKFFVKKINLGEDDLSQYQLIYIGKDASAKFDEVLSQVENHPVLTITDKTGMAKAGSCINFRVIQNRLKFEMNQDAIRKASLKVSSQLTNMAILI